MYDNMGFMSDRFVYCCKSEKSTGKTSNFFKYLNDTVLKIKDCEECKEPKKNYKIAIKEFKRLTMCMKEWKNTNR